MSFNMAKIAGIATLIMILLVWLNSIRMMIEQAKIDKAIVEYAGKTSKVKAKEVIKKMEELDANYKTFEATDIICDNDNSNCELW